MKLESQLGTTDREQFRQEEYRLCMFLTWLSAIMLIICSFADSPILARIILGVLTLSMAVVARIHRPQPPA